jgi:hypothetical protein
MTRVIAQTELAALGLSGPPFHDPSHGQKLPGCREPGPGGGEDRAPAARGGGLSVPHYPKAAHHRAWIIGACGLALCYPMFPGLNHQSGPRRPQPPGQHRSWQAWHLRAPVRGTCPRVVDRGDTRPRHRSIRPTASQNTAARRIGGGDRELTTRRTCKQDRTTETVSKALRVTLLCARQPTMLPPPPACRP